MKFYVRNFVRGVIDGILSVLGVIIGSSISGSSQVIAITGLTMGISNFMANTASAFSAERAEINIYAGNVAKSMLVKRKKIRKSRFFEKKLNETYVMGINDGVGTIFGAVIPLLPFLFISSLQQALIFSVLLCLSLLAVLGAYLGKISKTSVLRSTLKISVVGIITAALCTAVSMVLGSA